MKTVKVGSVGLGRLGYEHACNLATQVPGCELAAICDVDEKRVKEVGEELGVPYTYTDFEEMCPAYAGVARPLSVYKRTNSTWCPSSSDSNCRRWHRNHGP